MINQATEAIAEKNDGKTKVGDIRKAAESYKGSEAYSHWTVSAHNDNQKVISKAFQTKAICVLVIRYKAHIGAWSNGMIGVSKTFGEGSIPSAPVFYDIILN